MPEKKDKKFKHPHAEKIPEGVKEHTRNARSEMRESIKRSSHLNSLSTARRPTKKCCSPLRR